MIVIKRDKYPGKQGFPGYFCHISGDRMRVLFWETGMLVTALSADAFAAGLAYGAEDIRLPAVSLLTASAVSSLSLAVSLLTGGLAGGILPAGLVKGSGSCVSAPVEKARRKLIKTETGWSRLRKRWLWELRFPQTAWQPESEPEP